MKGVVCRGFLLSILCLIIKKEEIEQNYKTFQSNFQYSQGSVHHFKAGNILNNYIHWSMETFTK